MKSLDKYLIKRTHKYWLYYKITKKLLEMQQYAHLKKNHIFTKSLGTDSLTEARRLREIEIYKIHQEVDKFAEIKKEIEENSKDFVPELFDPFNCFPKTYEEQLISDVRFSLTDDYQNGGLGDKKDHLILDYLENKKVNTKSLKYLLDLLINEIKNDNAAKTLYKIKRSVSWFLKHAYKDDVDISTITFNEVSSYIVKDKDNKVAGSTIKGHMYGLSQLWQRARKSNVLSNDFNPFIGHKIKKNTTSYSPFTYQEIKDMYDYADGEMKTLIHAAYTTGARQGELLTSDVQIESDMHCWMFKFQDKGKNAHSTRVVPIHSSLNINPDFKFTMSARSVIRDFKKIRDAVIKDNIDSVTKKERKLSFHSFRSSFITELSIKHEVNLIVIASVTGHIGKSHNDVIAVYVNDKDLNAKKKTVERIIW